MFNQLLFHILLSVVIHIVSGNVNFALHRHANQSSTLNYNGFYWTADKAVDGNTNGTDSFKTCSATSETSSSANHTWEVDLGLRIIVKTKTVYGRNNGKSLLNGFKLYIGNASKSWTDNMEVQPASSSWPIYVYKPSNVIARFVSLVRFAAILVICEVTVEGDCTPGTYGSGCTQMCGHCYNGKSRCSPTDGMCWLGCEAGWHSGTCKLNCTPGTYGSGCTKMCGHCYNGKSRCSPTDGMCMDGCEAGWHSGTCKLIFDPEVPSGRDQPSTLVGTDSPVDDSPNVGVIVGSVLAALLVFVTAMVVIIVIVKKKRNGDNNETRTDMLKGDSHYENVSYVTIADASKISIQSKEKNETTFSAMDEACIQKETTKDKTKCVVHENSNQADNDYEKLRNGSGTPESAYSIIDPNLIITRQNESMENSSKCVETLESLESALKSVEEEICSLLIKKETLLCSDLERARSNKLADKRDETDSALSDKDKENTTDDYAPTLRSLQDELRILDEKRKCILERKSILLRQEQAKKAETKI